MVAVTCGVARIPADAGARAATQKGWVAHFTDALAATRMEQARRKIRTHTGLLPYTLDERGNRLVRTGASEMPFGL